MKISITRFSVVLVLLLQWLAVAMLILVSNNNEIAFADYRVEAAGDVGGGVATDSTHSACTCFGGNDGELSWQRNCRSSLEMPGLLRR